MDHTTIIEKTFTRQELVKAQQVINKKKYWASKPNKIAEKVIDKLLRNVKR